MSTEEQFRDTGKSYRFNYLFADDPNTTMPELREHHGQTVTVERPLDPATEYDFEGDPMYRVRFEDDYTADVWGFELEQLA